MSYNIILNQAISLFENGQFDEAEKMFRQILETAPNHPDILNLLGLVAQAKGAHSEACDFFYSAIQQKSDNPAFYYNIALSFKLDNKPVEALENFKKALALKPDIKEAYDEIASLYEKSGDIGQARKFWEQALSYDKDFVEADTHLALSYQYENWREAVEKMMKVGDKYPMSALPQYYIAKLYLENGCFDEAIKAALKAEQLHPDTDEVAVILGQAYFRKDNVPSAQGYFEKAYGINPLNLAALSGLADVYSLLGNFNDAEKLYRRMLELDKTDFSVHHNFAEMLYKQNRILEALDEYREAVILNPKSSALSNNLGVVLRECRDYEQAIGLFFNALSLDAQMEEAAFNAAETIVLLYRENQEKALKLAENWLNQMPESIVARHLCDSLKGVNSEIDLGYNQRLFEHFADRYELVVKNLGYTAPLAVGRIARSLKGSIVDLGCGTGLVGEIIKSPENTLVGVDLSSNMLSFAKSKGIYEELFCKDIISFLKDNNRFDWAVAVDVLGYLGALDDFFALTRGINLIFTTENYNGDEDYKIQSTGRYKHNDSYIEDLLRKNGYDAIYKEHIVLRQENGSDVSGTLWKGKC